MFSAVTAVVKESGLDIVYRVPLTIPAVLNNMSYATEVQQLAVACKCESVKVV